MGARDLVVVMIKQEHRSLTQVLHLMQELLGKVAAGHETADFGLLSSVLYYIDDFQERCHHPKEDEYLFKTLRAATSEFDSIISGLRAEHVSGAHTVAQLHRSLVHFQGGALHGLDRLKAGVEAYVAQMVEHMRIEEDLLDRSGGAMAEEDWMRVAAAFDENDDPLFGSNRREAFGRLYHRILLHTPRKLRKGMLLENHHRPPS